MSADGLTEIEKQIIACVQADLPVSARPYQELAERLGLSEEDVLRHLQDLTARGVIRRFGATLRHQASGFGANVLVAWVVEPERIETVGRTLAATRAVTHCYQRAAAPGWPYTLYSMVHAADEAACRETIRQMAAAVAVETYTLLFSRRELKKTSMAYFASE